MKRMLLGLALLQVFLVVALVVRIVSVWTTPLPEFGEIPDLPALSAVPPPRPLPKISEAVTDGIVQHDLFDTERGQGVDPLAGDITVDEAPVPPPSTVKLTGVMMIGREPVGFLLDTNVKPEQQAVRKGEIFGEYEVGEISKDGLLLLGGGDQQFQIPLRIEAASVAAPPPGPAPARGAAAAAAARPGAPPKPAASARPITDRNDAEQRAITARERAQAIAQRNAELRKAGGAKGNAAAEQGEQGDEAGNTNDAQPNSAQARLEALRQLREAAKSR
ncbi:MAG: hypothetical protein ABR538_02905 [Candidatus Binatia bacterium]